MSLSSLIKSVRDYKPSKRVFGLPIHFSKEEKIPLEIEVERFYDQADSTSHDVYLFLEFKKYGPTSKYYKYYSPLQLSLGDALVQEIYELLTKGNNARFDGTLTVVRHIELGLFPESYELGFLDGDFSIANKIYHARILQRGRLIIDIKPKL